MPDPIFDSALLSMCMTWRHDFGLLDRKEQMAIKRELLGLYEHHVKPAIERAETAESSLASMRQRAEELEKENELYGYELAARSEECEMYIGQRDAAISRAGRAEEALRSIRCVARTPEEAPSPEAAFELIERCVDEVLDAAPASPTADASTLAGDHIGDATKMVGTAVSKMETTELRQKVRRLEEALTPSADTKAAYIGEFTFTTEVMDAEGEPLTIKNYVPWTTTKEIMKAIRERAVLADMEQKP